MTHWDKLGAVVKLLHWLTKLVLTGKSVETFKARLARTPMLHRGTKLVSGAKKSFVKRNNYARTAQPTQVGRSSRPRRAGKGRLRNSAKKLGVTLGDALPALCIAQECSNVLMFEYSKIFEHWGFEILDILA